MKAETLLVLAKFRLGELSEPQHQVEELSQVDDPAHQHMAGLWLALGDHERARHHALAAYREAPHREVAAAAGAPQTLPCGTCHETRRTGSVQGVAGEGADKEFPLRRGCDAGRAAAAAVRWGGFRVSAKHLARRRACWR